MHLARRFAHALILVFTLLVGATLAAVIVSQTAWFKNWMRAYIVREASLYLNGTLSIERLSGNVLFGLEMENVDVSMDGRPVVAIKDMGLDYNIWDFFTKGLSVDNLRLDKPVIHLTKQGDTWTLSRLIKKQEGEANRRGPARPVAIEDIGISDGSLVIDDPVGTSGVDVPKRIDNVDAKLSFKYEPVHYSIEITHASFRGSDPSIALNALSGSVAVRDDAVYVEKLAIRTAETSLSIDGAVREYLTRPVFNLHVSSDKLSVPELARLFPALAGLRIQPQFEARIDGTADRLGVVADVVASAGRAHAAVVVDVVSPEQAITGDLSVRHLDLAAVLNDQRQRSDISADGHVDVRGASLADARSLRGTVTLDAPRSAAKGYEASRVHGVMRLDGRNDIAVEARGEAYGAAATAQGRVALPQGKNTAYVDLRGQARHVDLRRLPGSLDAPRAATDINADYRIVGDVGVGRALQPRVSGPERAALQLRFQPSTVAGTRISEGGTASATLGRSPIDYSADVTVSNLDVQRLGKEFEIAELAADRFASSLDGHVVARGRTGSVDRTDVTAKGTISQGTFLGGRVENMAFDAAVADGAARVKAAGRFDDFDPSAISERAELNGRISGSLDVDATVARVADGVTPSNVDATGVVTLEQSTIGGLGITRANLDASYHDSVADVRSLDVVSPDLNAHAAGTLALNETGASNLTVHADSSSLEALGRIVDHPLSGIANIDAIISGNRRRLEAKGHLVGDGVKSGDNGALTMAADFTAEVPDLSWRDASVTADTQATFVTVAGQNVNDVSGRLGYQQQQLAFDLTVKQPQRSLGAAGSLVAHPDHREVHLQKIGLETAGQTWQLAPGAAPTINYASGDVRVSDLRLVNGDQTLSAEGAYGPASDALRVTASNVDVANIDAFLLRPSQLSGRLNGTATVRQTGGDAPAPSVDAEFQVTNGGFRQFRYTSFGGTVQYSGRGMTVDTKLEQSPTTFITAKGHWPLESTDRFGLHVESTPIDLGLLQGLTTAVTNVTGTMQANIDVTGSADDPHPTGLITFQKGAFKVESTGVAYNNVEGKIELQPDRVHVGAISALDNHFNPVTISGDLAVHEHEVGDVKIYIHTNDFKVIDNELGNVRVNTDLEIDGELRAPRVTGDLGMTTGTIDLDRIMATIGESAYPTMQVEYAPQLVETTTEAAKSFDPARALNALAVDVHLTVPNDLIVKAADLQAPGSPVSLGSVNVTLGGDLRVTKSPSEETSLLGSVTTVRGTYMFQGRRFDILREGFVRFTGEPLSEVDPLLDIAASRMIQAVETHVNVRGRLRDPQFVLSSTPPLPDADILALILFNQPANMLGETQQISLIQQAQYLAGSSLTTALSQSIAGALHLDEFEINLAPESGRGPELRIGQQVGPNLYVKVEQGLGDQSQTNFVLEYELQRWLRMRTNVLQGSPVQRQLFQRMQGSGVDLLFFFSY